MPGGSSFIRRRIALGLLGWASWTLMCPSAALAVDSDFAFGFASSQPATATGLFIHIVYRDPANPDGKPSPIRRLVINAPVGTSLNVGAVPRCAASDQQIMAQGPGACPSGSQVGIGTLTADTGVGAPIDPYLTDVTIFNSGQGWIEVIQDHNTGATLATDRIQAHGATLTGNPPATPGGPPDGQTSVRTIDFTFPPGTGYITSPPSCSPDHAWLTTASFTFANGTTQRVQSTTPCSHGAAPPRHTGQQVPQPRVYLRVIPRRVHVGSARITFRVRSSALRCRRRVKIRFAGNHVRTDADGRVLLHVRFTRPGRYRATATTPGCPTARSTVRVTRS